MTLLLRNVQRNLLLTALACGAALLVGQAAPKPASSPVKYQPPKGIGAPKVRVTAASRGGNSKDAPPFDLLAPDHVGLTTRSQPAMYWYQEKPTALRIDFSLTKRDGIDPLVEWSMRGADAGLHRVDLSDLGVELQKGAEYEWKVAAVVDEDSRSRDVFAQSVIQYVPAPEGLAKALAAAPSAQHAAVYAEQKVWYDAVAILCEGVRANDPAAIAELPKLLRQVELKGAADAMEKSAAKPTPASPVKWSAFSRGAPKSTRTAASRGSSESSATVAWLAPDGKSDTAAAQPTLYWFVSAPTKAPVEIAISHATDPDPRLSIIVRGVTKPGIHAVRLADYGLSLKPGQSYEGVVQLVADEDQRSKNPVDQTTVRRLAAGGSAGQDLDALKKEGRWVDVVAALGESVETGSDPKAARARRLELLEDLGLTAIVEFEKAAIK